jgi:hypothetical protein
MKAQQAMFETLVPWQVPPWLAGAAEATAARATKERRVANAIVESGGLSKASAEIENWSALKNSTVQPSTLYTFHCKRDESEPRRSGRSSANDKEDILLHHSIMKHGGKLSARDANAFLRASTGHHENIPARRRDEKRGREAPPEW